MADSRFGNRAEYISQREFLFSKLCIFIHGGQPVQERGRVTQHRSLTGGSVFCVYVCSLHNAYENAVQNFTLASFAYLERNNRQGNSLSFPQNLNKQSQPPSYVRHLRTGGAVVE